MEYKKSDMRRCKRRYYVFCWMEMNQNFLFYKGYAPSLINTVSYYITDTLTCYPNPCKNNGICKKYKTGWIECQCQENYVGYRCEYPGASIDLCWSSECYRAKINMSLIVIKYTIIIISRYVRQHGR